MVKGLKGRYVSNICCGPSNTHAIVDPCMPILTRFAIEMGTKPVPAIDSTYHLSKTDAPPERTVWRSSTGFRPRSCGCLRVRWPNTTRPSTTSWINVRAPCHPECWIRTNRYFRSQYLRGLSFYGTMPGRTSPCVSFKNIHHLELAHRLRSVVAICSLGRIRR
jgi:hypothetical protein